MTKHQETILTAKLFDKKGNSERNLDGDSRKLKKMQLLQTGVGSVGELPIIGSGAL